MPSPNWNSVETHARVDHEMQHKGMRLFLGIQTTLKPSLAPNAFEFALPNIELRARPESDNQPVVHAGFAITLTRNPGGALQRHVIRLFDYPKNSNSIGHAQKTGQRGKHAPIGWN